jgi:cytochrome c oxidase assembly protein subunit 15
MRRLTTFQRLALGTTAATYLLILVGGLVRASGAGLGCPDWPQCFGSWIPPLSAAELPAAFDQSQFNPILMWTEYLNRVLGVTIGFLILATAVVAVRHYRRSPHILWPTVAALLLVGFQGWLGGVVVEHELAPWIVTVHLIVALIIVQLLLYSTVYAFLAFDSPPLAPFDSRALAPFDSLALAQGGQGGRATADVVVTATQKRRAVVWSTAALIALTLTQVALGAQVRGRVDDALAAGTPRGQALATVGTFDTLHRDMALVILGLAAVTLWQVVSRHASNRTLVTAACVMVALALAQIVVGLTLAYAGLTPPAQVAHLTAASLLLGAETVLFLLARWLPCD